MANLRVGLFYFLPPAKPLSLPSILISSLFWPSDALNEFGFVPLSHDLSLVFQMLLIGFRIILGPFPHSSSKMFPTAPHRRPVGPPSPAPDKTDLEILPVLSTILADGGLAGAVLPGLDKLPAKEYGNEHLGRVAPGKCWNWSKPSSYRYDHIGFLG